MDWESDTNGTNTKVADQPQIQKSKAATDNYAEPTEPTPTSIPTSYKDKVTNGASSESSTSSVSYHTKIKLEEGDSLHSTYEGIPDIVYSRRVNEILDRNMSLSLIVRPLGKFINYRVLYTRLTGIWRPKMNFGITDLPDGFFLLSMGCSEDYNKALLEGPWSFGGHYIRVFPWQRDFNTKHEHYESVLAWIRIPRLPPSSYQEELLRDMTKELGSYIKADPNTLSGDRGLFARVALRINLTKPLIPNIRVNGSIYPVEYEDLTNICYACACYGHSKEECKSPKQNRLPNVLSSLN